MEECWICGDNMNKIYVQQLCCGHKFHYECILRTLETDKDTSNGRKKQLNYCPFCSREVGLIPIVNGLTKIKKGIHYGINEEKPKYENSMCKEILKSGKNKGRECKRRCKIGEIRCGNHL